MVVLNTDRIRKELAGVDPEAPMPSGYGQGIYAKDWTHRTYAEVLRRAQALLAMGESVVLDGTWGATDHRAAARRTAEGTSSDLVQICCVAASEIAAARMSDRRGPSDAGPSVAEALARDLEPWPEATTVDTGGTREAALLEAAACLDRGQTPKTWRRGSIIEPG
jgi:predicted kinase